MFTEEQYQKAADDLRAPVIWVKACAQVESGGVNFWDIDGEQLPPVRHEAHWFGKLTGYIYNEKFPSISCRDWNPAVAAKTWKGAWEQHRLALSLAEEPACASASWGPFQVMGFNGLRIGYGSAKALKEASMNLDGQMEMFVRFIISTPHAHRALQEKDAYEFARYYNGEGNINDYAPKILADVARLS